MMEKKKNKVELLQEKLQNETNEYRKKQLESKIALMKKKMIHNSLLDGTYRKVKVINK